MDFEVYCDESHQEYFYDSEKPSGRFVILGGIWIKAESRNQLKSELKNIRTEHGLFTEFKWKKISLPKIEFYTDIIKFFFKNEIRFRCILLPVNELDAIRFHDGDSELMFYKFYYQLLHHWILDFNKYKIFLDLKTNRLKNRITKLSEVLQCSNITSKINVQALPSKEVDLLQVADLLIGAVSYKIQEDKESPSKLKIIEIIEKSIGHEIAPTTKAEEKFNIFRFQPGGGW